MFGGHPSIAWEGTLDIQGLGVCYQDNPGKGQDILVVPQGRQAKPEHHGVASSDWKVANVTHARPTCQLSFTRSRLFHFLSHPCSPTLSPFHLLPVRPWQVLKVMVTAERVALPNYSKEQDTLNYRK